MPISQNTRPTMRRLLCENRYRRTSKNPRRIQAAGADCPYSYRGAAGNQYAPLSPKRPDIVVNPDNDRERRFSLPFLVHPRAEAGLSPRPKFVEMTGGTKQFPDISARAFLRERLAEIGLNIEAAEEVSFRLLLLMPQSFSFNEKVEKLYRGRRLRGWFGRRRSERIDASSSQGD
jgi:hypothetical protein